MPENAKEWFFFFGRNNSSLQHTFLLSSIRLQKKKTCKRSVCVAGGWLMRTYFCDIFFLLKIHVIRLTSSSSRCGDKVTWSNHHGSFCQGWDRDFHFFSEFIPMCGSEAILDLCSNSPKACWWWLLLKLMAFFLPEMHKLKCLPH